ncbi:MAG: hypothetical protein GY847_32815 [Proteobacteria bacterium]|nr:hypothetical protein [Pseudomonadota bacterium]
MMMTTICSSFELSKMTFINAFAGNLRQIFIEDARVQEIMADPIKMGYWQNSPSAFERILLQRQDVLAMWEFLFQMQTGQEIDKDDVMHLFSLCDPFQMIRTDWQEDLELVLGMIQLPPLRRQDQTIQMDEWDESSRAGTFGERFLSEFETKAAAYCEQNHPKPRTPPPYLPIDFSRLDYDYSDYSDRGVDQAGRFSAEPPPPPPGTNSPTAAQLL